MDFEISKFDFESSGAPFFKMIALFDDILYSGFECASALPLNMFWIVLFDDCLIVFAF